MSQQQRTLSYAKWSVLVAVLSLLISCGDGREPQRQSAPYATASIDTENLFYPFECPNFDTGLVNVAIGNQSARYWASAKDGLLRVGEDGYARTPYDITLNLITGAVSGYSPVGPDDQGAVIAAPEKGGSLVSYLNKLQFMAPLLRRVGPPASGAFIASVIDHVKDLKIEDIAAFSRGPATLGQSQEILVRYKTDVPRDILVTYCGKSKCYVEKRLSVPAEFNQQSLKIDLPKNLDFSAQDWATTYFMVSLVPSGGDAAQKISAQRIKLGTRPAVVLQDIYNDVWHGITLVRGKDANLRLTLKTSEPVQVVIRLLDKNNVLLAAQTYALAAEDFSEFWHETRVAFAVPADIPLGSEVHFTGRILKKNGLWDGYEFGQETSEPGNFPFHHVISDPQPLPHR